MRTRGQSLLVVLGGAIGVACAVLIVALAHRSTPPPLEVRVQTPLLPEASGGLAEVVMHYVPRDDELVEPTYTDFLRAIAGDVQVVFVVAEGLPPAERAKLDARLATIDPTGGLAKRVTVVTTPGPITTWSKDRALVTSPAAEDQPVLLLAPAEPHKRWPQRYHDWLTIRSIAAASGGRYQAEVAPFDFDAGDFAVAGEQVIVDTNLLEKNEHRGIRDIAQLRERVRVWLHMPVVVLGQRPGDTPRHHLAMYLTPLHDRVVLVGDPAAARELVGEGFAPGESSLESGEPLQADFSQTMTARFQRAASELERHGYQVERIPNVPLDDKTYISYTNGVFEERAGERIAYVPMYGIEALDEAARLVYERLGWQVRPIRVRSVYRHHGTIGCLVNVLRRR